MQPAACSPSPQPPPPQKLSAEWEWPQTTPQPVFGESVTLMVTISGSVSPTGTVDFLDGVTPLCSAVVLTEGTPTVATASLRRDQSLSGYSLDHSELQR